VAFFTSGKDTERVIRKEFLEKLEQAAMRVERWPAWKQTMFQRMHDAEQYFARGMHFSAAAGWAEEDSATTLGPEHPAHSYE
jgi:hypothetical protein